MARTLNQSSSGQITFEWSDALLLANSDDAHAFLHHVIGRDNRMIGPDLCWIAYVCSCVRGVWNRNKFHIANPYKSMHWEHCFAMAMTKWQQQSCVNVFDISNPFAWVNRWALFSEWWRWWRWCCDACISVAICLVNFTPIARFFCQDFQSRVGLTLRAHSLCRCSAMWNSIFKFPTVWLGERAERRRPWSTFGQLNPY